MQRCGHRGDGLVGEVVTGLTTGNFVGRACPF
jgi:hypothetical protein